MAVQKEKQTLASSRHSDQWRRFACSPVPWALWGFSITFRGRILALAINIHKVGRNRERIKQIKKTETTTWLAAKPCYSSFSLNQTLILWVGSLPEQGSFITLPTLHPSYTFLSLQSRFFLSLCSTVSSLQFPLFLLTCSNFPIMKHLRHKNIQ